MLCNTHSQTLTTIPIPTSSLFVCLFKLYAASPNKMVAYLRGTAAGDDNNQHKTETIKMSVWIMYRYLASEKKDVDFIF